VQSSAATKNRPLE